MIQDSRIIEVPKGKDASMKGAESKSSRCKDGSWTMKAKKFFFGFKLHIKIDALTKMIKDIAITPANVHDNKIDLSKLYEMIYRDRGYSGHNPKAMIDATMKKCKFVLKEYWRNKRITKIRVRVEHVFGVMDRSLNARTTKLTTIERVSVQQTMICLNYNIGRAIFLLSEKNNPTNN